MYMVMAEQKEVRPTGRLVKFSLPIGNLFVLGIVTQTRNGIDIRPGTAYM